MGFPARREAATGPACLRGCLGLVSSKYIVSHARELCSLLLDRSFRQRDVRVCRGDELMGGARENRLASPKTT